MLHLKKENAFTAAKTQENKSLEKELYDEHLSHLKQTDQRPAYAHGDRFEYYTRTVEGLSYKIHCRRPIFGSSSVNVVASGDGADEEVLLDENKVAKGQSQCDICVVAVSPCHEYLAYCVDFSGDEVYHLRVLKLGAGAVGSPSDGEQHVLIDELLSRTGGGAAAGEDDENADAPQGEPAPGTQHLICGNIVWGADSKEIFYVTQDPVTHRPNKMWRHKIGEKNENSEAKDPLFEEKDQLFILDISKTKDGKFLLRNSASSETSEVAVMPLEKSGCDADATMVHSREFGLRYEIEHWEGYLIAVTNYDKAKNNRALVKKIGTTGATSSVLETTPDFSAANDWQELFPYDKLREITYVEVFENFLMFEGRENGLTKIWSFDIKQFTTSSGTATHHLQPIDTSLFPEPDIHEIHFSINKNYATDFVRLVYSSLVTPTTWYEYRPLEESCKIIHEEPVPNFDKSKYDTMRVFATNGKDGCKIPVSLVWSKELCPDVRERLSGSFPSSSAAKSYPLLLYGYGSYGACVDPGFDRDVLTYLDRGIIYAIAHIRGGGEMGREVWYEEQGKYLTKKNTFEDFIACAEFLTKPGGEGESKTLAPLTTPSKLAIEGRSAGGLLIGAVLNMRPDLFSVAVAGVPFVDVLTTMADPSIPLTIGEWEEWGNPNLEKFYKYMKSYSPVDNVSSGLRQEEVNVEVPGGEPRQLTTVLILAGLHDPRVAYWEPAKWAQLLRKEKTRFGDVLLKVDLEVGHFSASDRYRHIQETSFSQAVVVKKLMQ